MRSIGVVTARISKRGICRLPAAIARSVGVPRRRRPLTQRPRPLRSRRSRRKRKKSKIALDRRMASSANGRTKPLVARRHIRTNLLEVQIALYEMQGRNSPRSRGCDDTLAQSRDIRSAKSSIPGFRRFAAIVCIDSGRSGAMPNSPGRTCHGHNGGRRPTRIQRIAPKSFV